MGASARTGWRTQVWVLTRFGLSSQPLPYEQAGQSEAFGKDLSVSLISLVSLISDVCRLRFVMRAGEESLYYVGHSQGTMVMFGLLSIWPEYQKKVKAFAALAPVANVTTITSPIRWLTPLSDDLAQLIEWMGTGEFLSNSKFINFLAKTVCDLAITREICEDAIFLICGPDSQQLNITRLSVYLSHTPAGTSVRNVLHYAQLIKARRFQMYDFGVTENQKSEPQRATNKKRPVRFSGAATQVRSALSAHGIENGQSAAQISCFVAKIRFAAAALPRRKVARNSPSTTTSVRATLAKMAFAIFNRGQTRRLFLFVGLSSALASAFMSSQIGNDGYGQATPPEYDTRNIHEVPIALYWSSNDWFGDPADVKVLEERLPSLKRVYEVPDSKFTHLDFVFGIRAAELVYADMLDFFDYC
ncbi:gastric triacylglycerol lipase-like [Tropilaelaps mercedesae]|uniref:Gastric triacylglycerol lipase-like n=1 Tax=Tropilaelaps mercedesae TaxID=418985 RepID=A0A1V9XB83_9ACAR|nr:gastric triacylglycerol lipase-like [Tropilaelaps mercedesae]